jgi:hypothetical protein
VDERLREHADRIRTMESGLSDLRVSVTQVLAKQESLVAHFDEFRSEVRSNRDEVVTLLREQRQDAMRAQDVRHAENRAAAQWLREIFTPQTIVIILTILAGAFGISLQTHPAVSEAAVPALPASSELPEPAESPRD